MFRNPGNISVEALGVQASCGLMLDNMSVNINSDIWSFTLSEDVESIGELLKDGVSVDARNSLGETPLHLAAGRGLECVAKVPTNCI